MLDPLTAIGLASAIVQFVACGSKVIGMASEIYKSADGTLKENVELENWTTKVDQLSDRILLPSTVTSSDEGISDDEKLLTELAKTSKGVAGELLSLLHDLRSVRSGSHKKWESLRKAVSAQTPWNKDKIQRLESKLKGLREEISHRLIIMIRCVLQVFSVLDKY